MRLVTADAADPDAVVIDLDPAHWARQGRIGFEATLDGAVVVSASLVAGFMHRGAEKLFEARDYRQGLALANRHDWLAPAGGEILMARAAEDLLGLPVPERARRHRALLLETTRIAALCAFLGPALPALGSPDADAAARDLAAARERVLALIEELTGARMHVTYTVIGGVREAVDAPWCDSLATVCDGIEADVAPAADGALDAVCDRWSSIGVIPRDVAASQGASGIVGRASGIDLDVRRSDPDYDGMADLLQGPVDTGGGVSARMRGMLAELGRAIALVRRLSELALSSDGPVNSPLPKVLRVPVGRSTPWLETPLGAAGALLESRGDRVPYRYALRTPSFAHAPLVARALVGHTLDDAAGVISSFPLVVGDLDK